MFGSWGITAIYLFPSLAISALTGGAIGLVVSKRWPYALLASLTSVLAFVAVFIASFAVPWPTTRAMIDGYPEFISTFPYKYQAAYFGATAAPFVVEAWRKSKGRTRASR